MKKSSIYILLFLLSAMIFSQASAQVRVRIKSDIGTYLCVCTGCVKTNNGSDGSLNTAMLHCPVDGDWFSHFDMQKLSNGNYVFRSERGQYMGICTGCVVGTTRDFITFHSTSPEPWTQFEVRRLQNGKYSIRSAHNGNFVGRCNSCSPGAAYPDQVAAHAGNAGPDWAQWDIEIY